MTLLKTYVYICLNKCIRKYKNHNPLLEQVWRFWCTDHTWTYFGVQPKWWPSRMYLFLAVCRVTVATAVHKKKKKKLSEVCASSTHDFIIPQLGWVWGKMWALLSIAGTWAACGPLLDSWQVDRSPTRERQFHGPHCLNWLLLWSQESRARDSR